MEFKIIGSGAISPEGKLLIKVDEKLLPLVKKGTGVWLRSKKDNPKELVIRASLEGVLDDKKKSGKVDVIKLSRINLLEATLKETSINYAKVSQSTEAFLKFSVLFLASLADSLSYLIQNKNFQVFEHWLTENDEIDSDVKSMLLAYLSPVKSKLGGNSDGLRRPKE